MASARIKKSELGRLTLFAMGGMTELFRLEDQSPLNREGDFVYKEFTASRADQARSVEAAVEFRSKLTRTERAEMDSFAAWPQIVIEDDSGVVTGFLMPFIGQDFYCDLFDPALGRSISRPREMSWLIASAEQRKAAGINLDEVDTIVRLILLAKLTYSIAWLHQRGWVFGDLSFRNAVFSLDAPRVMLLDCDGASALNDFGRRQASTPFWDPPECTLTPPRRQELQDTLSDVYKIGLAILRCLTPGKGASQTRDSSRISSQLDAAGIDLVARALSSDRGSRPSAKEIYDFLYNAIPVADRDHLTHSSFLRVPPRPLAGVRSDVPSAEDYLGMSSDAEALADLVTARETVPPLAIALLGEWGSGKSSAMLQIQRRIEVLAEMSRNDPAESLFSANVRQIRFNAWDYADQDLWPGLMDHLFQALATDPAVEASGSITTIAETERTDLKKKLDQREAEELRLSNELSAADSIRRRGEMTGFMDPTYSARVFVAAAWEMRYNIRAVIQIVIGWLVLAAVATATWTLWGSLSGALAAMTAALIPATVIARRLRDWHKRSADLANSQRQKLDSRQRALQREIADLRERLALADAASGLSRFLTDRAASGDYSQYRSLVGKVRGDLERLSEKLKQARDEWISSGASGQPPLERIVLYIDDLDRCPPQRVVEVLEAVHLMLALDLFVVVVAVDARWLIRSLELHHRELFSATSDLGPTSTPFSEERHISPADYLDKIFQIPYALTPPPSTALSSYLRFLLPLPVVTQEQRAEQTTADVGEGPLHSNSTHQKLDNDSSAQRGDKLQTLSANEIRRTIQNLKPPGLQLTPREVQFMSRLAPLLSTPRAAKRLANLYRLVRIGIPDADLANFIGSDSHGPYQVVQVLLAILVGSPSASSAFFEQLMRSSPEGNIFSSLKKAAEVDLKNRPQLRHISTQLGVIFGEVTFEASAREYQAWCPNLARHSFHAFDQRIGSPAYYDPTQAKSLPSTDVQQTAQSAPSEPGVELDGTEYDPDYI